MEENPKYLDESLSFQERAEDLVSRMTLEECAAQLLHDAKGVERLGVKDYNWWNEALHGVARAGMATVFPQAIGEIDEPLQVRELACANKLVDVFEHRAEIGAAESARDEFLEGAVDIAN